MPISLDALQVLDAIARNGSFAAAAAELARVPSAITYTVRKLEQELGVRLFDRSGYRAEPTPAGEELVRTGRQLLRAATELEGRVRLVSSGWESELAIVYSEFIELESLLPLLGEFYAGAYGTRIRLAAETGEGAWDALRSGRADLAIGAVGALPSGSGIAARQIGTGQSVFVCSPEHRAASLPEPISADSLQGERFVELAGAWRGSSPLPPEVLLVSSLQLKLAAQEAGLGVGYLPLPVAQTAADAGRLVIKAVDPAPEAVPLLVAWRTDRAGKTLRWFTGRLADRRQ